MSVGGNNENNEKKIVSPDAAAPSTVSLKELSVSGALAVGVSFTENSVQLVEAEISCEADAKTVPSEPTSDAVRLPEKVDPSANLKLTDAV